MLFAVVSFGISMVCCWLLWRVCPLGIALDPTDLGPQKFHKQPVPRVGGLGIMLGLVSGVSSISIFGVSAAADLAIPLLLCSMPALCAGLAEDLTKRVGPLFRLCATGVAAALAAWALGAVVHRTDIPGVDTVISSPVAALVFTVLLVAGMSNAINIIDGFNGLAATCVSIMLAALSFLAYRIGDEALGGLALVTLGGLLGFLIWNYPRGYIFLGDGGAYLCGFLVAELGVLLLLRNPDRVSPLFPLLICVYPLYETVFSIWRRAVRRRSPFRPDAAHLHSLVYRRVDRYLRRHPGEFYRLQASSTTAPLLWLLCLGSALPALLFADQSEALALWLFVFILSYHTCFAAAVRGRIRFIESLLSRSRP